MTSEGEGSKTSPIDCSKTADSTASKDKSSIKSEDTLKSSPKAEAKAGKPLKKKEKALADARKIAAANAQFLAKREEARAMEKLERQANLQKAKAAAEQEAQLIQKRKSAQLAALVAARQNKTPTRRKTPNPVPSSSPVTPKPANIVTRLANSGSLNGNSNGDSDGDISTNAGDGCNESNNPSDDNSFARNNAVNNSTVMEIEEANANGNSGEEEEESDDEEENEDVESEQGREDDEDEETVGNGEDEGPEEDDGEEEETKSRGKRWSQEDVLVLIRCDFEARTNKEHPGETLDVTHQRIAELFIEKGCAERSAKACKDKLFGLAAMYKFILNWNAGLVRGLSGGVKWFNMSSKARKAVCKKKKKVDMEEETFNLMTTTHDGSHAAIPPNFLDTGVGIDDED
jgi:hypothetical protein